MQIHGADLRGGVEKGGKFMDAYDTITGSEIVKDTKLIDIEVARRMVRDAVQADRSARKIKMIVKRNKKKALVRRCISALSGVFFIAAAPVFLTYTVDRELASMIPVYWLFALCYFLTELREIQKLLEKRG